MVSDPTSREWINRAVRGDVLAVQKLIMVHHARLRAIAYRRISPALHAKIEPEDVLQQVYTDAIQRIGELQDRGEDAFFRWLRRILESKLVDAHRYYHAAARDVKREVPPVPTPSGHDWLAARVALDTLTPSRIVARDEASALLMAALAGLSEDHRRVLELRFLKGCPLVHVAELMGRSTAAVQMLSARALQQLRRALVHLSRTGV